jgi:hypothetical protein
MRGSSTRGRFVGVAVGAAFALFLAVTPAAAAPTKITGKLTKAGLTVIALDKDGEAASKRAKSNGEFKLRAPAKKVTLHLRGRDGTYAGPVVIAKKGKSGKTAILGLKAPASLGKVQVRKGYANLRRKLPRKQVDRKRTARAKRGVPRGAGNFGRVRSRAAGPAGPGLDQDRDGIPDTLDVDDDGDLVLDNLDGRAAAPTTVRAGPSPSPPVPTFNFDSQLSMGLSETVNVNSAAFSPEDLDAAVRAFGVLRVGILPSESPPELDCGEDDPRTPQPEGLVYCRPGGTGTLLPPGHAPPTVGQEFPECCDPDGDGFGTLSGQGGVPLAHGATPAQIATGDLPIELITSGGAEVEVPAAVPFVFSTTPALVSYDDETGGPVPVVYPADPGAPGTPGNGFPVADSDQDADQDVELTLELWRPQRTPIEGERCPPPDGPVCAPTQWIDIGGLSHSVWVFTIGTFPSTFVGQPCPPSALASSDPELMPPSSEGAEPFAFIDLAADGPAHPDNRLTYTLNLTQCLASLGVDDQWTTGEEVSIDFRARAAAITSPDSATQLVAFERQ